MTACPPEVREEAEYLVMLVNGSAALENQGLTPDSREKLVDYAVRLILDRRQKERDDS